MAHAYQLEVQTLFKQLGPEHNGFSEVELENGTRLCYQALDAHRTAMADELRRLAVLYETYFQLLKLPFVSQHWRPSVHHVPEQFAILSVGAS